MMRNRRILGLVIIVAIIGAVIAGLTFPPQAQTPGDYTATEPAKLQPISGTHLQRITLTPKAAERLGIETAAVREEPGPDGAMRKVVPYSAVIYEPDGTTWAYTTNSALTYVRQSITVERIQNNLALLTAGPPVGTQVVTVGATELLGAESDIGH